MPAITVVEKVAESADLERQDGSGKSVVVRSMAARALELYDDFAAFCLGFLIMSVVLYLGLLTRQLATTWYNTPHGDPIRSFLNVLLDQCDRWASTDHQTCLDFCDRCLDRLDVLWSWAETRLLCDTMVLQ